MEHKNLRLVIFDRGIRMSAVADAIGVTTRALYNKLEGRTRFTWEEACIIQDKFFPDRTKDELFIDGKSA